MLRHNVILSLMFFSSFLNAERRFPNDFQFGVSTSAHQIEGAWNESGKGESCWDTFTHDHPEKIVDGSNADVTTDSYHLYRQDIVALKDLGVQVYRFSISWTRLLPTGYADQPSKNGEQYYNDLIDELLDNGIEPFVTLFHWDTPKRFQDIGGFTNRDIVDIFADYAEYAFEQFGDRVKKWVTFNEVTFSCLGGYGGTLYPPSLDQPGVADYICVHHMLLAHAKAYRIYDEKFRRSQKGEIGIVNSVFGYYPISSNVEDIADADLAQDFTVGWVLHPIFSKSGGYPPKMKEIISQRSSKANSRLPLFTKDEIALVKGSADFFGMNHYRTIVFSSRPVPEDGVAMSAMVSPDLILNKYSLNNWTMGEVPGTMIVPEGLRNVLTYIKREYGNPPLVVTEHGFASFASDTSLIDHSRVDSLNRCLESILLAILLDGVDVRGYMHWSLMDNFEWDSGFTLNFGLHQVNFSSPTKERIPRLSSAVYKKIIKTKKLHSGYDYIIDKNGFSLLYP